MRILKEIPHPQLKITLMSWNEKYIVKIEAGPYEQTYKIRMTDVTGETEVEEKLSPAFLERVMETFKKMHQDMTSAFELL